MLLIRSLMHKHLADASVMFVPYLSKQYSIVRIVPTYFKECSPWFELDRGYWINTPKGHKHKRN